MNRVALLIMVVIVWAGCTTVTPPVQNDKSTTSQSVLNKTWQWVSTITPAEKIEASNPERYTILLSAEGKLKAQFDCNSGGGDYEISDRKLSFGPLISTRMACPEGTQDYLFMKDLQRVQAFFLQGEELFLVLPMDSGTMRFREAK